MTMIRCARASAVLVVLVSLGGCGVSNRLGVHPVHGEVTVGGQPAVGARVFFHPAASAADPKGLRPFAVVEPDGTFHVTTYLAEDGAPAGEYVVTVTWPAKAGADEEAGGDRLRNAYADPRTSKLRAVVAAKDNVLEPFRLK